MKNKFSIIKNFKIFGFISILLCITGFISLVALLFGKNMYNLAIDFAGGTQIEMNIHKEVTADISKEIASLFEEKTGVKPEAPVATGDDKQGVMVKSISINSEQRSAFIEAMKEKFNLTDDDLDKNEDVSASVGNDLKKKAVISSAIAVFLMLIYISFRFEFTSGLAAVCCLIHDILAMLSIYVILQIPLNQNFIAAALTILGYSINASIIVFDRVRENLRLSRRETFEEIAEKSIWQTIGRTINTTLTTMFTIGMIFILGVSSLRDFALPLIVGIISGAYSSIFISSPLWCFFRKKIRKKI